MTGHATVGVDDDLAAGEAGVAHRAAEDERSGRVDQQTHVGRVEVGQVRVGEHRIDDVGAQIRREQVVQIDIGGVLRRDDDRVETDGLVAVVLDGDLGLAVGTQVRQDRRLADLGEPARQAMCEGDRQRHEFGRVGARVAEHQALVAGALAGDLVVGEHTAARLVRDVDAAGDLGRLRADRDVDTAGVAVEAFRRRVVADLEHPIADDLGDVAYAEVVTSPTRAPGPW